MKIIELILDEEEMDTGIEAISIVESPAIESDFVALKNQEIKLAEVDADKQILMGALLIPNKPIYRNGEEGEYYIYFSKDTIVKASQLFLQNGNQSNSTLEHNKALNGLTLVESWIVESEQDKSRHYGLNVPVGTWMGSVKVNNSKIWEEYVKTKKVKGFSIEGYFADKMEQTKKVDKEDMEKDMELEAKALLNKIEKIVRGEKTELGKVELGLADDLKKLNIESDKIVGTVNKYSSDLSKLFQEIRNLSDDFNSINDRRNDDIKKGKSTLKEINIILDKTQQQAKDLGIAPRDIPNFSKTQKSSEELRQAVNDMQKYSNIKL